MGQLLVLAREFSDSSYPVNCPAVIVAAPETADDMNRDSAERPVAQLSRSVAERPVDSAERPVDSAVGSVAHDSAERPVGSVALVCPKPIVHVPIVPSPSNCPAVTMAASQSAAKCLVGNNAARLVAKNRWRRFAFWNLGWVHNSWQHNMGCFALPCLLCFALLGLL